MDINVRMARMDDLDEVLRLLRQIAALHEQGRPDIFRKNAAKYEAEEYRRIITNPDTPVFIAEGEDGAVLGYVFCQLQVRENHPLMRDMRTLYVDDLCVDEAARGRHIGTALMDAAVAFAREKGCHNVDLNVWEFNEGARAFYERYGMHTMKRYMELIL